jgi:hypothetical protein
VEGYGAGFDDADESCIFGRMKLLPRPAPAVLLLGLWLSACAVPSTMSRVNANRAQYETWPPEIKEAVLSQKAIPGMNPDMVRTALGKPTQVIAGANPGEEVWIYRRGGSAGGGPNLQIGTNLGGMQVGTSAGGGGMSNPGDEDLGEVMFKDGLVVRSNVIP